MKVLKVIKYTFTIIGIGMLVGAFFIYKNTSEFIETSTASQGTVIELLESRSTSSSGSSITYSPLVHFIDEKGNQIEFLSSTSSNPPSYNIGEKVEVLYNPASPNEAKIKSFFSIWGGTTIVGMFGVVFFFIGGAVFVVQKKKSDVLKHLKQNGTRIASDFQHVGINTSFKVNGRSPYQIVSQWQNPATSKLHVFTSENI